MPSPILAAESILATALASSIRPLLEDAGYAHGEVGRAFWRLIPEEVGAVALPYVIYQPQSDLRADWWLGAIRAEGLVLLKGLGATAGSARAVLAAAAPGMDALTHEDYTIQARYEGSPTLPIVDERIWQAGHLYRVRIGRAV
jgi:hypothetical protein